MGTKGAKWAKPMTSGVISAADHKHAFLKFQICFVLVSLGFFFIQPLCSCVFVCLFVCQVMVTNVTSLLKTVKAVEDEATRGTRALEATIECIKQELAVRHMWIHEECKSNFMTTEAHRKLELLLVEICWGQRISCLSVENLPAWLSVKLVTKAQDWQHNATQINVKGNARHTLKRGICLTNSLLPSSPAVSVQGRPHQDHHSGGVHSHD